ncbi:MAG TPA: MFS transporter [Actinomycetota bacterium]|nr:MFS transporter [Actinomycetota bacterium]
MRQLLRDRDFRFLLAGQTLSAFGDYAMFLAIGIWAKELTGSNAAAGLTILPFALPALAGPALGVIVDRFPRRHVMIATDLLAAAVVLGLLAVDGPEDLWILYSVSFATGAIVVVYQSARAGLLRGLLDEGMLGEANGLLQSTNQGMRLLAPLTGAALFVAFGGWAIAILDATTFLLSAALLAAIHGRDLERRRDPVRWWPEIREGLHHIVGNVDLRRLTIGTGLITLLVGCTEVMIYALIDEGLHRPASFLGVLATLQGVGSVLGGLAAGAVLARWGELRTMAIASAGAGVGMIVFGTARMPLVIAACVCFGVIVTLFLVGYQTLMQRRTPLELQGRVMAAVEAAVTFPYVVSIAIGAAVVAFVPYQVVYTIGGVGGLLTALYFLRGVGTDEPVAAASDAA